MTARYYGDKLHMAADSLDKLLALAAPEVVWSMTEFERGRFRLSVTDRVTGRTMSRDIGNERDALNAMNGMRLLLSVAPRVVARAE